MSSSKQGRGDFTLALIVLAFAFVYYRLTVLIPDSLLDDAVGPRGLPIAYATLLALLGIALIVSALRQRRTGSRPETAESDGDGSARPPARRFAMIGMVAIGVAYVTLLPTVGYIPSIALLLAAAIAAQSGSLTRSVALVAVCGAIVFWLLFVMLLRIPQPAGVWPSLV